MRKLAFITLVLTMTAGPFLVLAQGGGGNPPGGGGDNPSGSSIELRNPLGTASTPMQLLERVLTYLLRFGGVIGAIMIIIGAFQILFAGGDPEKFSTGKRTVIYTAIAYAILLMARGIVSIIENFLTGTP